MSDKTINFYEKNHKMLIKRYNRAKLEKLHLLFRKNIKQNDKILDIGFGSGRDLRYIHSLRTDCYGAESCNSFLNILGKDKIFKNKLFCAKLPNIDLPIDFQFNTIILIAVIMHLSLEDIEKSIIEIKKYLKDDGIIIISYSTTKRENDERFFENLNEKIVNSIFLKNSFYKIETIKTYDGMQRKIEWITTIYKVKKV